MIYKKYTALLAISFISLIQGAASSSSSAVESPKDATTLFDISAMQTIALFHVDTVQLPYDGLIHMPFLKGLVTKPTSLLDRARRFRGYIGFASGPHKAGVHAMAHAAGTYHYTESSFDSTEKTNLIILSGNTPQLLAFTDDCQIVERCVHMTKRSTSSHGYMPSHAILPYPYEGLLNKICSARAFETIPALVAAIKAATEGICALAKEKNPAIKLVQVPMLVQREDLTAFRAEMFPPRAK